MNASPYEQELATSKGVVIRHWLQPKKLKTSKGKLSGIKLEYTEVKKGKFTSTGLDMTLPADQVLTAIGQKMEYNDIGNGVVALNKGRIKTNSAGATSLEGVWAGGDCTDSGDDLTVTAVAQGRDAAEAIHQTFQA